MKHNWSEIDVILELDSEQPFSPKPRRSNQRKWREIEAIKERGRLRRELARYDQYDDEYFYEDNAIII